METPAPNPSDPEDVATALETAAIFAAKGDASEAARWLGRAADFATLSGDATRGGALARSARSLAAAQSNAARAGTAAEDVNDVTSEDLTRLPEPPPRQASVRPLPPSERPERNDHASQPMLLVRPSSSSPAPPRVAQPTAASVRPAKPSARAESVRPVTPAARPLTPSPAAVARVAATALAAARSPAATAPSTPTPLGAKDNLEESAVRESSPRSAPPPKPSESVKPAVRPSLHHELHRPFRLSGSRVSLAPSQASSRFYVLKVLEDGEPVPAGEYEAFVVLVDPNATR